MPLCLRTHLDISALKKKKIKILMWRQCRVILILWSHKGALCLELCSFVSCHHVPKIVLGSPSSTCTRLFSIFFLPVISIIIICVHVSGDKGEVGCRL